jgi:hypothetical protein
VTNHVCQARGCAYHGWRSGWDIMLQFWLLPPNEVLDLGFLTFRTFRKSVKSCIVVFNSELNETNLFRILPKNKWCSINPK